MADHQPAWTGIFPIGASDPLHLPVNNMEQSLPFYQNYLACTIVSREDQPYKLVMLQRDQVRLGLTENGGNPEEHSCVIAVNDLDGLYQELHAHQLDLSAIRPETHDNQPLRIFFLRAPDGLCFCFSQRV
jgi:lactoylglutathione lyase